jgi:antitoxin (DNA-binding transcriptional repressor) of toxin-antitoxin stability system
MSDRLSAAGRPGRVVTGASVVVVVSSAVVVVSNDVVVGGAVVVVASEVADGVVVTVLVEGAVVADVVSSPQAAAARSRAASRTGTRRMSSPRIRWTLLVYPFTRSRHSAYGPLSGFPLPMRCTGSYAGMGGV